MSKTHVKLNTGALMPTVGLGTWLAPKGQVGKAIEEALRLGVRHIDCAAVYQNEDEVGEAFEKVFSEGKIKREEVFIVSKLWNTDWKRPKEALEKTLKDLKLKYLDLYLVHSPYAFVYSNGNMFPEDSATGKALVDYSVSTSQMWAVMEQLVAAGLTKAIGVSNFPVVVLRDLLSYAKIVPAVNQIEVHPYFTQDALAEFSKSKGIQVTAYSPLAHAHEGPLQDPAVLELSKKYNVTPAQVLIRWSIDKGHIVIPKSTNAARIKENFNVFGFQLTDPEVEKLSLLDRKYRSCDLGMFWNFPVYD